MHDSFQDLSLSAANRVNQVIGFQDGGELSVISKSKPEDKINFLDTLEIFGTEGISPVVTTPVMAPTSNANPPMDSRILEIMDHMKKESERQMAELKARQEEADRRHEESERQRKAEKEEADRRHEESERQRKEAEQKQEELQRQMAELKARQEKSEQKSQKDLKDDLISVAKKVKRDTNAKVALGAVAGGLAGVLIAYVSNQEPKGMGVAVGAMGGVIVGAGIALQIDDTAKAVEEVQSARIAANEQFEQQQP